MANTLPIVDETSTLRNFKVALRDFTGGLNTLYTPFDIAINEVQDCDNVLFDEEVGAVVKRPGYTQIPQTAGSTLANEVIVNSYVYEQADGTRYLIVATVAGKVYASTDRQTWTLLVDLTDDFICNFETFENILWIVNGTDTPRIWDGTNLWVLDGTTWTSQHAAAVPAGYTGATGDNSASLATVDGQYIKKMGERLFIADTANEPSGIFFSRFYDDSGTDIQAYHADAWPATNLVRIGGQTGRRLTGIFPYSGIMVAFKEDELHGLRQTGPSDADWTQWIIPAEQGAGCLYHRSAAVHRGRLLFLGTDGVYSFDGSVAHKISRKIQPTIDGLQSSVTRSRDMTWTSKADWDGGATKTQTSQAFQSGAIMIDASVTDFPNNSFEDDTYWDTYNSGDASETLLTNNTAGGSGPYSGSRYMRVLMETNGISVTDNYNVAYIVILDSAGNELGRTSLGALTSTYAQKTVDLTAYNNTLIKIALEGQLSTPTSSGYGGGTSEAFWCKGGNITFWGKYVTEVSGATIVQIMCLDLVEDGYTVHYSTATWESQIEDLGQVNSWSAFISDYITNSETVTFKIRSGASSVSQAAANTACGSATYNTLTDGAIPVEGTDTFVSAQLRIEFATADTTVTPEVNSIAINWYQGSSYTQEACAVIFEDRYMLSVATNDSTYNNKFIVIDSNMAFTQFSEWDMASLVVMGNDLIGGDSQTGHVNQLMTGYSDNGSAIDAYVVPTDISFFYSMLALTKYFIIAERENTTDTINADYKFDDNSYTTKSITLSGNTYDTYKINPAAGNRGKFMKIRIRNNTDEQQMDFKGIVLVFTNLGEI